MRTFHSAEEIKAAKGEVLGSSHWLSIDQERINNFAHATGDNQWIHVDVDQAADGPFGTTIAHGYLTLSLIPYLGWQTFTVAGSVMGVNAGLNRVRFLTPVKVGSRVRATGELTDVTDVPGGVQMVVKQTIELEGSDKPACVAETVTRVYF